jgi:hypothetical protein
MCECCGKGANLPHAHDHEHGHGHCHQDGHDHHHDHHHDHQHGPRPQGPVITVIEAAPAKAEG